MELHKTNGEPSTEDIVAKQNDFISKLENTFNLWEASIDLDKLSLDSSKPSEKPCEARAPPQFHEFGLPTNIQTELEISSLERLSLSSASLHPSPSLAPPRIVITEPAETAWSSIPLTDGNTGVEDAEMIFTRMSLAHDGVLAAAAAARSSSMKHLHASKCPLCGLDKGLRSHRARCGRRRGVHFSCPSCRAPFARRAELVAHMRRVVRSKGRVENSACPSCRVCRRSYTSRGWGENMLRGAESTVFVEGCGFVSIDE